MTSLPEILKIQLLTKPPQRTITVAGSKGITNRILVLAALLACGTTSGRAETGIDPRLKTFATEKRRQMEKLAAKLHLDVPPQARKFFKAAEMGSWTAVSNSFERISPAQGTNGPLPGLKNVLFEPTHETWGAYAEFSQWDRATLQTFADGILGSIPAGSIYFGGTGSGRFIITVVRDVAKSPDIFIITQNLLGIASSYTDYLRLTYGRRIWIPSEKDVQQAFQQTDYQMKEVNGWTRMITGLTRSIFEHNKDRHGFYVEESIVIPWMYPYMEPHGMILKLNKEPLKELDPSVVAQDRHYWDGLSKELLADPKFLGNEWERRAFSKLRSAIGGVYMYRHMTNEAVLVYKQAVQLYPADAQASFRLAELYMVAGRLGDAVAVLEEFKGHLHEPNPAIAQVDAQIRDLKRQAAEKQSR